MDPATVTIPPMKDLTVDNITENTIRMNSLCKDARTKYIFERLVSHMHDFARETRLSSEEWMAGLLFLTQVGQICSDVRQVRLMQTSIGLSGGGKVERFTNCLRHRNSFYSPTSLAYLF